ncbi:MAG: YgiQ family radical SAM protein [Spirochaetota bacterium]
MPTLSDFLPVNKADLTKRGWEQLDFILITGDAYVDHPSFGAAIISRYLESEGFKVGIVSQPNWKSTEDVKKLGKPRLAFLITSGNLDSMVNRYTAAKKIRRNDAYSPGGRAEMRPDRACIVYSNLVRQAFKSVAVILGGIEASLRRLAHYDYWSDKLRRSILLDSKADMIVYGMGEKPMSQIARQLQEGAAIHEITAVAGTAYKTNTPPEDCLLLPGHERLKNDPFALAESFKFQMENIDPFRGKKLAEPYGTTYVVQNPPSYPLSREELDRIYELPYTGRWHPFYDSQGGVPALEEVKFSITSHRGCFGECSFCALSFHQGRIVQSRSHDSIIREAIKLTQDPDFKGYIHDVGGPTANFRFPACEKQLTKGACPERQCLFPTPCRKLETSHKDFLELLRKLRRLPGVKGVFIRSGIRFDYLLADGNDEFLYELCAHHVSGQLKVAPEHISERVLNLMGKPAGSVYQKFVKKYTAVNKELGKKQYLVPYFISSHPGSTLTDAIELAEFLRDSHFLPEQVQDFYPTPGTLSTCMYFTGLDPRTMQKVYVPRSREEKEMQRALLQFRKKENYTIVRKALLKANRKDLIGFSKKCLVRPSGTYGRKNFADNKPQFRKQHP